MSILVATDFSPEAEEACRVGADLARAVGDSLTLVHVLEPSTCFPLDVGEAAPHQEVERLHAAQKILEQTKSKLGTNGLKIATEVTNGFVEDALNAFVRARHSTLLLVGGAGAEGQSSFRDLAEKLAESMPCPVMVIRPVTDRLRYALSGKSRLRIFVGIDRTLASDAPIAWVRNLRERIACDILVGYFYVPSVEHRRLGLPECQEPFKADPEAARALEREIRHRFEGLGGEGSLTVHCEPHFGSISVEALCSARVANADLIVVGSHRRHGISRFMHGSVSRDIIRHSDIPVVCVGAYPATHPRKRKIHKVLAATDLSERGNRAVAYAYDLLSDGSGAVDIVYVATGVTDALGAKLPGGGEYLSPAQRQAITDKLQRLVPADIEPSLVTTRCIVIDGGPAVDAILQTAARSNADAICVASAGPGALDKALGGSVALAVAQEAQCPVLVVRDLAA